MISNLITGRYFTALSDGMFRIIQIILRIIEIFFKLLNRLLVQVVFSKIDSLLSRIAKWSLARRTQVDDNTIMLTPMQGEYTCNTKYIGEEILRRKLPYNIIWVLRGASLGPYPPEFRFVKDGSVEYFTAAAKSKVVIQNGHSLQKNDVQKNKNQYWMQTWHGSLGLKRLEGAGGDEKFYNKMRKLDSKQTDFLISNSEFENNVFSSTYWPNVPILQLGHARNDILFDQSKKTAAHLRAKVLQRLGIKDNGQRFILFAPTHDDKNLNQAFGNIDFDSLREALSTKFGGTWEILIRTHNSNKRKSNQWLAGLPLYCHNSSFYPDMQELLVVADVGLTDYSSWICDYILTRKPSFLYGANVKKFNDTRGFYHKIEDTPYSMATSNRELLENISKFDQKDYEDKIVKFLDDCKSIDDGKAAKRIVDKIEELMAS